MGWGVGERKRQRGGAFPFGLIESAAVPLLGEVAKPIFKKIFGRGRRKRKCRRRWGKQQYYEDALHQNKLNYLTEIPLQLHIKDQVDKNLPKNVTVRRTRWIGPKKQQKRHAQLHRNVTVRPKRHSQKGGRFLSSGLGKLADLGMKFRAKKLFKKGLDVGSRAITSEIGKKLIGKGIKHAPELYKIGTSK